MWCVHLETMQVETGAMRNLDMYATQLCVSSLLLGKTFYQNLLRCKKKRKEGKSRWGKKKRCMLPLFCWGDSIWGHFTFHRLPAVPVFFAKEEKCSGRGLTAAFWSKHTTTYSTCQTFQSVSSQTFLWCIRSLPCGFKDNAVVTLEAAILPKIFRFGKVRSWDTFWTSLMPAPYSNNNFSKSQQHITYYRPFSELVRLPNPLWKVKSVGTPTNSENTHSPLTSLVSFLHPFAAFDCFLLELCVMHELPWSELMMLQQFRAWPIMANPNT